jgi:hypothetical protein
MVMVSPMVLDLPGSTFVLCSTTHCTCYAGSMMMPVASWHDMHSVHRDGSALNLPLFDNIAQIEPGCNPESYTYRWGVHSLHPPCPGYNPAQLSQQTAVQALLLLEACQALLQLDRVCPRTILMLHAALCFCPYC